MKNLLNWIATDGLLHSLACALLSLSALYLTDCMWIAAIAAAVPAIAKEYHDVFVQKDNNLKQAAHDIICDIAGLLFTLTLYLIS